MPAYQRDLSEDAPQPVTEPQPRPARRGGKRMKLEPSADPPDAYYTSLPPDQAMAASAIFPPGGHDAGGESGLGTAVAN